MSSESPVIDREEVERTLCQVAEIQAARVVSNKDNLIQELHILASGAKAPRQIVRDVESLLMARFGIPVDHKKISIAQINDSNDPDDSYTRVSGRLKISNITIDVVDHKSTLTVRLTQGNNKYTGTASGQSSQKVRLRQAALATLDAVSRRPASDSDVTLEHVSIAQAEADEIAIVCVSIITRAGEKTYAGSAMVKGNESESVVKATLSAINRHLTFKT